MDCGPFQIPKCVLSNLCRRQRRRSRPTAGASVSTFTGRGRLRAAQAAARAPGRLVGCRVRAGPTESASEGYIILYMALLGTATLALFGTAAALHVATPRPTPSLLRSVRPRLCAAADDQPDVADMDSLYKSLQQRRTQLSSRADAITRERELVAGLADVWPKHEIAQKKLWQHWYGEEGEAATDDLVAAEGDASALLKLMEEYPDWVEPQNRLATLRYMDGDYEDSVSLCLRILRNKPWHFGAAGGIVMCYVKLAEQSNVLRRGALVEEANRWALEAMPPQAGRQREEWVERMLASIDAKLAELSEMS